MVICLFSQQLMSLGAQEKGRRAWQWRHRLTRGTYLLSIFVSAAKNGLQNQITWVLQSLKSLFQQTLKIFCSLNLSWAVEIRIRFQTALCFNQKFRKIFLVLLKKSKQKYQEMRFRRLLKRNEKSYWRRKILKRLEFVQSLNEVQNPRFKIKQSIIHQMKRSIWIWMMKLNDFQWRFSQPNPKSTIWLSKMQHLTVDFLKNQRTNMIMSNHDCLKSQKHFKWKRNKPKKLLINENESKCILQNDLWREVKMWRRKNRD